MYKKYLVTLALVIVVTGVALGVYVYLKSSSSHKYAGVNTPNKVLMEENQDFNTGKAFQKEGNYVQALAAYNKALPQAKDATQEAQIEFDIAYMTEKGSNHLAAIPLFKNIATYANVDPIIRAYAVQELAIIYSSYEDTAAIAKEIYKDAPYNAFLVNGDTSVAYRKLYEYSASIYPLGGSEAHIAAWYADDLRNRLHGASTTPEGAADLALVSKSISAADADIPRMKNDIAESGTIPDVYMREALALADMAAVGVVDPAQAEDKFKQAIITGSTIGISINFANLYYAYFLATEYGNERLNDIQKLLSVYSEKNSNHIYKDVPTVFKAVKTDSPSLIRTKLLLLSKMDPDFKNYLLYLGWHDSDFAAKAK